MIEDYEMLEINQTNTKYLKPDNNTERVDNLINEIDDIKNNIL